MKHVKKKKEAEEEVDDGFGEIKTDSPKVKK
jgi:hypothetical protein